MKQARFLIRLANLRALQPADQKKVREQLRALASPQGASVANVRITPVATEFDLFCDPAVVIESFVRIFDPIAPRLTLRRLDGPEVERPTDLLVDEARHFFNEHRFWEVHEALEPLWKRSKGDEKRWVQGLILLAAAGVHVQRNENAVVPGLLREAAARLEPVPGSYFGWDLFQTRERLLAMVAEQKFLPFSV